MKYYLIFSLVILSILIIACSENDSKKNNSGKDIFKKNCVICHGIDGTLGLNGAKDLTKSTLSIDEKILQVTNGKGLMTPFKNILTETEIKQVVDYVQTMKK